MDGRKRVAEQHAEVVKDLHQSLRKKLRRGTSPDTVWSELLKDTSALQRYSNSMHLLANDHWKENATENRINWCHSVCKHYFKEGGMLKAVTKQEKTKLYQQLRESGIEENDEEREKINETIKEFRLSWKPFDAEKLLLLDVGSCFNPFKDFPEFLSVPIDISPATEDVLFCDFLNVVFERDTELENQVRNNLTSSSECSNAPIDAIKSCLMSCKLFSNVFDIVVFSLLLSYFPSPSQRLKCCVNAHNTLKLHGLLLIITPDSSHQNRHTAMMKAWKYVLESIGFRRYKYEKLQHLHCMAYRKSSAVLLCPTEDLSEKMYIPQDLQDIDNKTDDVLVNKEGSGDKL